MSPAAMLDEKIGSLFGILISYDHEDIILALKAEYDALDDAGKAEMKYSDELLHMTGIFELYRMGDVDLSGSIDKTDLSAMLGRYSRVSSNCDIVGNDDVVDSDDLSMLLCNYGKAKN
ncbi:MAG: hypothetical protein IKM61_09880 [Eubacteriaceae bacterium]|nr:hypothetical protein [Eubacteriaceae bacterium]